MARGRARRALVVAFIFMNYRICPLTRIFMLDAARPRRVTVYKCVPEKLCALSCSDASTTIAPAISGLQLGYGQCDASRVGRAVPDIVGALMFAKSSAIWLAQPPVVS